MIFSPASCLSIAGNFPPASCVFSEVMNLAAFVGNGNIALELSLIIGQQWSS